MLFITYWELNEDLSVAERMEGAQQLMSAGLFPQEDVNTIRWDITPDGWGVTIFEADNEAAVSRSLNMWRQASPGLFTFTKTSTARPVQEEMETGGELVHRLASS
jgi:hypothetical protein